jgi:hypothetical protein
MSTSINCPATYDFPVGWINHIDTNRFNSLFALMRGSNCPSIRFFTSSHTHLPTKPFLSIRSPARVITNNAAGTCLTLHVTPITKPFKPDQPSKSSTSRSLNGWTRSTDSPTRRIRFSRGIALPGTVYQTFCGSVHSSERCGEREDYSG